MRKCEWKNGSFHPCSEMAMNDVYMYVDLHRHRGVAVIFCPFCGADIRKPEEEPLIVKSGGTWVAHWKDVDYLCTNPDHFKLILKENWQDDIEINSTDYWKPFSEIELTDDIAKLRPMVIDCKFIEKLYAIENNIAITDQYKDPVEDYRLATPHELQEAPGC